VLEAADRAAHLTKQLLLFSRRHVIEPQRVELGALSDRLIHLLRRVLGEDIEIVTRFDATVQPVHADPHQIEQVLMNLAINARDAMEQGGQLTVETSMATVPRGGLTGRPDVMPGTYVRLAVSDTGCGITPEIQARIFDPFFTTKREGHGTGLGLSTVYGIVKQHGGFIHVESQPGAGSTFSVYLPAAATPRTKSTDARDRAPASPATSGRETILLVDDEELLRELVRDALVDRGYSVIEAADGRDGVRVAGGHTGTIDLLVTDMVMPHLSGDALARSLRHDRPALKVLFLSGYPEADTRGDSGAFTAFLPKPFQLQTLLEHVRSLLDAGEPSRTGAGAL
jgi:CheY-like chemotaxis protein